MSMLIAFVLFCFALFLLCSVFEAIPDKLPPDEILHQAQDAAATAADALASQAPSSKVCDLRSYT